MCTPEAQDYFSEKRTDDPGIADVDRLLRHCRPPVQVVPCKLNGQKFSDQIFRKKRGEAGLSIDLECLLLRDKLTWEHRFGTMPGTLGMVAINAGDARSINGGVAWTPKPAQPELEPNASAQPNPYHGELIGEISRSDGRSLSRKMVILKQMF